MVGNFSIISKHESRGGVEDTRLEAKDRSSRGQGPRTQAQVFSKKEKVFQNFFSGDLHWSKTKKGLHKFFARFLEVFNKISTVQKMVLTSSRGQGNFRGLEAWRPRTSKCVLENVLEAKDVLEDSTSAQKCLRYCILLSF